MKVASLLVIAVGLVGLYGFTGCGASGLGESATPSTTDTTGTTVPNVDLTHQRELDAARSTLAEKKRDRDAEVTEEAAFEQKAASGEAETMSVKREADEIDRVVSSWGGDYVASITDLTPTSIEKMVSESSGFMEDLHALSLSDTPSYYQAAAAKYIDAAGDLALAERVRLAIIYTSLGMVDKVNTIEDDNVRSFLGGATIGQWIAAGSKVNDLIRQAVCDISAANAELNTEQQAALAEFASDQQTLKSKVESLNQEVAASEARLTSLGGTP